MQQAEPSRVAIASDQAIFLRGLAAMVMAIPGVQLVGEASSPEEVLQLCRMTAPSLLVLDWRHPMDAAVALIERILGGCPAMRILLLAKSGDCLPGGLPVTCISREASGEELRAALERVPGAQPYAHPAASVDEEEEELAQRSGDVLARELVMAGKIQADILPEEVPSLPGWDISASLVPARETSGDFYDFLPITHHKLGLVMADVTDKGMGAALFMVLSNTLIRTFAVRFPTLPAVVLSAVSERILSDTRGGMFVTAFFGVLEPHTGNLLYANAGHPSGVLVRTHKGRESVDYLHPTGMALGVSEEARWRQKEVKLGVGDCLVLYTDGISESQNAAGEFFGEEGLVEVVLANSGAPARTIRDAILAALRQFHGHARQHDDVALIVIRRFAP